MVTRLKLTNPSYSNDYSSHPLPHTSEIAYNVTLNAKQFAQYVRLIVKLNLHTQPAMIDKLNTVYKKKLRRWNDPQYLKLPLDGGDTIATSNLSQMLIVDYSLRYDRTAVLNSKAKRILEKVRDMELTPQDTSNLLELPYVFEDLVQICGELEVLLHPVIVGPYYLELADPLTKRVLEWDRNWDRYPPYRRFEMQDYATRKHRYLLNMGWTTLKMSLHDFTGLDALKRHSYVHQFVDEHALPRK